MFKKSVSPLIATVLLIAFTVAIGSVVMNWGTTYIKSEQESATSTSDVRLKCATNVNLKIMKIKGMQDYCYTNDSENVTISVRLTKGNENLKGIRVNIISNNESQTLDYSEEIDKINFHMNLGGFNNNLKTNNNRIEYVELVPYIDNNGLDYYCSGSNLVINDLYPCGFEINNPYIPNEIETPEQPETPEDPEPTGVCTTYLDCSSGQFCDIEGLHNDAGTCVDFCEGGPETINQTIYGDVGLGLEYTQALFGSNFTIDSDWNYSCQSYATTLNNDLCPEGMAFINKLGGYCIDKYDAYAQNSDGSDASVITSTTMTNNLLITNGKAGSAENKSPWAYITLSQSQQACENAGKYLCTNAQWQGAANLNGQLHNLNTMDTYGCVVNSATYCSSGYGDYSAGYQRACKTGYNKTGKNNCVSYEGVYDLFGNVRNRVNETITTISSSGYKYVSDLGVWVGSNESIYRGDVYFNSGTSSSRSILRGDFWLDEADAGPFSAHLYHDAVLTDGSVGFRCCSSTLQP